MIKNNIGLPPRLKILWKQSYLEEGLEYDLIPNNNGQPVICLFPRSFLSNVLQLESEKCYDFNFRGTLYIDKKTFANRKWILDFTQKNFDSNSFFQVTDKNAGTRGFPFFRKRHKVLGEFDQTFKMNGFVPKENPIEDRGFFEREYFEIMNKSRFTLCPAGDAPWSMRFFEAILSKSIPVLERKQHSGRNYMEYEISYKYYLKGEKDIRYRKDWADSNFEKFLQHQTLLRSSIQEIYQIQDQI